MSFYTTVSRQYNLDNDILSLPVSFNLFWSQVCDNFTVMPRTKLIGFVRGIVEQNLPADVDDTKEVRRRKPCPFGNCGMKPPSRYRPCLKRHGEFFPRFWCFVLCSQPFGFFVNKVVKRERSICHLSAKLS